MTVSKDNSRMSPKGRQLVCLAILAGLVLCLLPGQVLAQGCAMCGTALKDQQDPLTRSISASTLFMMSMPFFLFFSVAGWLVYMFRRADRSREIGAKENQI